MTESPALNQVWPEKKAALIAASLESSRVIKEIFAPFSWELEIFIEQETAALQSITKGKNYLLIYEEPEQDSVYEFIRKINREPQFLSTPLMMFLKPNSYTHQNIYKSLSIAALFSTPPSPSKATPTIAKFLSFWETTDFKLLRACNYHDIKGNQEQSNKFLASLIEQKGLLGSIASRILALKLEKKSQVDEAEKVLINAIKIAPQNLGLLLMLGEFYLNYNLPQLALKVFQSALRTSNNFPPLLLDIIQAKFALKKYPDTLESLITLSDSKFFQIEALCNLYKIYMMRGIQSSALKLEQKNLEATKHISKDWRNLNYENKIITAS
ncbi:MAG: hypothetical protein KBD78_04175 [Oligoflexales bacterium]|nr:hypothetical protein [Oligoflexales bacterium]